MTDARTAPETGSVLLQLKVRLLGISPMIWRRVLVPDAMSLHEFHGVLQVAMEWETIHLFEFSVRGAVYAGPSLHGQPVNVPLSDFRFRRNAKIRYVYDMGCWWEHELRVEDRMPAVRGNRREHHSPPGDGLRRFPRGPHRLVRLHTQGSRQVIDLPTTQL